MVHIDSLTKMFVSGAKNPESRLQAWSHTKLGSHLQPLGAPLPLHEKTCLFFKKPTNFLLLSFCLTFPYSCPLEYSLCSLCRILPEYILIINPVLEKEILVVLCLQVTGITRSAIGKIHSQGSPVLITSSHHHIFLSV